jgi:hypothetical protein
MIMAYSGEGKLLPWPSCGDLAPSHRQSAAVMVSGWSHSPAVSPGESPRIRWIIQRKHKSSTIVT